MNERDFYVFLRNLNRRPPSSAALAEARTRVIDALSCFYGAADLPAIRRLNHAFLDSSDGPCSRWGSLSSLPPERAVLLNGAGVRALDYNDTYLSKEPCHPSDTLAALWAAAELSGGSHQGRRVLEGLVRSYDVMVRLCDAGSLRARGWDHVTYLPIASAVGASHIFNLSIEKTIQAVSLAVCGSFALRQTRVGFISDWKAACAANAARAGLIGALLARSGFTGPSEIFSGRHGFEKQTSVRLDFDSGRVGNPWGIFRTHMKYFPAEHHAQSAIESGLALRSCFNSVGQIREMIVEAFEAAVSIIGSEKEKWVPSTRETADHSLPFLIAMALMEGDVTLEQYEKKRYLNPAVRSLMKKIKIRRRPQYDHLYPQKMPTRLTVILNNGQKFSDEVLLPKGYAGRPFDQSDLYEKFERLVSRRIPEGQREKLWRKLSQFEQINKLSTLRPFMRIPS